MPCGRSDAVPASVSSVGQRNTGSGLEVIVDASRGNSCWGVSPLLFFARALTTNTKMITTIMMITPVVHDIAVAVVAVMVVMVVMVVVVVVVVVAEMVVVMVVAASVVVAAAVVHIFDIVASSNSLDIAVPSNMFELFALE